MKKYKLTIESDVRDIQLLTGIIEDNSTVDNMLVREHSNLWTFEGNDLDEVEDMEHEINEMIEESKSGCIIYTNIEYIGEIFGVFTKNPLLP